MIELFPAAKRFVANHGWLVSGHHFSFADYYDPNNQQFGPLRVFNDDFVAAGRGFGAHPHKEMEIVSIVLKGQLKHQDNTGRSEVIGPGEVQRMTAGTGIVHSEFNPSDVVEVNFLQLWFFPNERGLTPEYEQKAFEISKMKDEFVPLISTNTADLERGAVRIHQDVSLFMTEMDQGVVRTFSQEPGKRIYVYVLEGDITLNSSTQLGRRDAARITGIERLELFAEKDAHVLLIDLP